MQLRPGFHPVGQDGAAVVVLGAQRHEDPVELADGAGFGGAGVDLLEQPRAEVLRRGAPVEAGGEDPVDQVRAADEIVDRVPGADDGRAEHPAQAGRQLVDQGADVVRQVLRLPVADGGADRRVPLLRRRGGDEGARVLRDVDGVFARRQVRERLHGLVVAQGVAAQRAVRLRERPREVARDPVVHAVDARKRLPVVDAGLRQHLDHGRADLEARVGRVSEAVDPFEARLGRGQRAELRAHGDAPVVGPVQPGEADDRLLELADERRLAQAGREGHRLAGRLQPDHEHRLALRARMPARFPEDLVDLEPGVLPDGPGLLPGEEVHVAGDERLGDGHPLVLLRAARPGEIRVDAVALVRAVLDRPLVLAGVQLVRRADRAGADGPVDRGGVAVEDGAHLLARERPEAALAERLVDPGVRAEPEFAADGGDLLGADAAVGERLHERVLDRENLLVGEGLRVAPLLVDVVVDLAEPGLAFELHLAGVVLAGRDVLELLDRDVDAGEVDGHGGLLW